MKRRSAWLSGLSFLVAGSVMGAGFQLYTEGSAEALGQAGAISGRDDLVSLAWYNPSALAGSRKISLMAGAAVVQIGTDFTSPAGNASMADDWRVIPHLYGVLPVSAGLTALLSVNAPYGLITEWPDDWAGNALATYTELSAVYVTPSIALSIGDRLKLGAGFNVVVADAELGTVSSSLAGDDLGYGYTASAHYSLTEDWALGGRYQSRVDLEMEGDLSPASIGAKVDLTLPSTVNVGLVNTSFRNLALGLDVVWTEWSTYDRIAIVTSGGTTLIPKEWDDVWSIRAGAEYRLSGSWKLRGGYVQDASPIPERTRSPELPGSDRQMVMAGVGWGGESLSLDLAYSYLWADSARMGTVYPLPGEFETDTQIVSVSLGYSF